MHTNSKDEALSLPTEEAKLALRTQQVIAYESGVTDVVDPLAGSYYIENLTDKIEKEASELIKEIDEIGGAIPAIENHFQDNKISNSAFEYQKQIEEKKQIIVGTNKFIEDHNENNETLIIDQNAIDNQLKRLKKFKQNRNTKNAENTLSMLNKSIKDNSNLLEPIIKCIKANCTLGRLLSQ